jgi:hypothetical protein
MTDVRLTQGAVEQWASGTPAAQLTQVAVEEWASVTTGAVLVVATQIGVEQWGSVAATAGGGATSQARAMVLA